MPGFFSHYLCGCRALDRVGNTALKSIIEKYRHLYNLGAQGPDIFFYYGFWPWVKSGDIHEKGEHIHAHGIHMFFSNALKYIAEKEPFQRYALASYLCGYACHYSLDSNTHPYIFYKTGFVRKGEKYNPKYTCYHRDFETTLDFLLVSEMLKCRPSGIRAAKLISLDRAEAQMVAGMFEAVLKSTLDMEISIKQIKRAIKDMGTAVSVLRDRTGLKKRLLSGIESGLGGHPLLSSMIHPLEETSGLDYLNLRKAAWSLPWDKEAKSTSSFGEMFDNAAAEAAQMYEAIYGFIGGSISGESALAAIGNRSFSTGADCSLDLEFKFFDCIYE